AARLFKVEYRFPPTVIGHSTVTAMQSGLLWGYVSLIEGLTRRVIEELGAPATVVATGGLADLLAEHTPTIHAVDQELTVDGLFLIWQRNRR
ncbi:MAG: type III pantothenate kinase, partial [Ardenticatenia bacterium]|nr:type III pantothenate kinase [Ardenticatenia bacterium]